MVIDRLMQYRKKRNALQGIFLQSVRIHQFVEKKRRNIGVIIDMIQ